jgi:hypothetical protein
MSNQVNKAIERVMYTHDGVEPPVSCPRCGQALIQETGPYLVATRRDWRLTDNFMASGDFGYLCAGCDTAVIHTPELATMLYGGPSRSGWKVGPEFSVLGLINLDAVPPEKAHIPIPDLDPLPLARFHSRRSKESRSAVRKKRPHKPKPKRRR